MWSLAGATLYQMVDMEGQVMQHDLQSGEKIDIIIWQKLIGYYSNLIVLVCIEKTHEKLTL